MPTFLHVGCGESRKPETTPGFNRPEWEEVRLDVDPQVEPDILGSMIDMAAVADASMDAIFSSHNIEHLYPFEAPMAVAEFARVLKPDGFLIITCPDLQAVGALLAEGKLLETAYTSPAGPITPLDILYGYRPALARGSLSMAHRCGFTQRVLSEVLRAGGFTGVLSRRRESNFDLWAAATLGESNAEALKALARDHFPAPRGDRGGAAT